MFTKKKDGWGFNKPTEKLRDCQRKAIQNLGKKPKKPKPKNRGKHQWICLTMNEKFLAHDRRIWCPECEEKIDDRTHRKLHD